jgi:hypothetical protein
MTPHNCQFINVVIAYDWGKRTERTSVERRCVICAKPEGV